MAESHKDVWENATGEEPDWDNDDWAEEGEETYVIYDEDHHRGAPKRGHMHVALEGPSNIESYGKGRNMEDSGNQIKFSQMFKTWENTLRSFWFSTNLHCDDRNIDSDIAYLVGLTLQFFTATVPSDFSDDFDKFTSRHLQTGPASKIDIMSLNKDDWSFFGYYLNQKNYTEFELNFFLTDEGYLGVDLRNYAGDCVCTNKLVHSFYAFLQAKGHDYVEFAIDSESERESSSSEVPNDKRGIVDLACKPSILEGWLDTISKRKGKRQTMLKLAHAIRGDRELNHTIQNSNRSYVQARNSEMEVSQLIAAQLWNPKARASGCSAAVMCLELLHERITDQATLRDVVHCFFELLPSFEEASEIKEMLGNLGTYAAQEAEELKDDCCQNLKRDLFNLIEKSDVSEGLGSIWKAPHSGTDYKFYERLNEILEILEGADEELQPSYMRQESFQILVDAVLPSNVECWKLAELELYTMAHVDVNTANLLVELRQSQADLLKFILADESLDFEELREKLKDKIAIFKKGKANEVKKSVSVKWKKLEVGEEYVVRKDWDSKDIQVAIQNVETPIEPWLAGMRLSLKEKDEDSKMVVMEHRNGSTSSLPRVLLSEPPEHNHPHAIQISVLTANPTIVDQLLGMRPDMSEFLNSMRIAMRDIVEKSPYETTFYNGVLNSKNLTNERNHIIQIQGLCPRFVDIDEEREEGLILEDKSDMGVVADLDDLHKRHFKLYSCKLLVLAQRFMQTVLTELHHNQKVQHILALNENQELNTKAVDFLKIFYDSLQLQCLTIQASYEKAKAKCGARFILYPEIEGYHEKRLIDLVQSGISEKPAKRGYKLTHACIPNNIPNHSTKMFGCVVPPRLYGPIANDFVHRICAQAMRYSMTFAECPLSPVFLEDVEKPLFEYSIDNLAANVIYQLFRSEWNDNDVSNEHKYKNGIAHINVEKGSSGGDILQMTYQILKKICKWDKNYKKADIIKKKLVKKIRKKKICLIFQIPDLGDSDLRIFLETIKEINRVSTTVRMIFLIQTNNDADALSDFKFFFRDEFQESHVEFDLEDEDYLAQMLQE